jgi:lauroyl/myristoyl acyltransferase
MSSFCLWAFARFIRQNFRFTKRVKPSSFYRSELWRVGLAAARVLPRSFLERAAVALALGYHAGNRLRREIVIDNLLPALQFDRTAAERKSRDLFTQFGLKLADLWRYEAGCEIDDPMIERNSWARFEEIRSRGRGVLLITPHIGNWEFGAPFLRKRGISLQVITQAEPQDSLTELRKSSRARWGIETLVIGENPFAFVEVIRRLESGATVALLMDRPPAASATTVKLFGRPFQASIAAAELARASGCSLLPVCLPRVAGRYSIEILPEAVYERSLIGSREGRAELTAHLVFQFQPFIQKHLDQWFHFVPLWLHPPASELSQATAPELQLSAVISKPP